MFNTNKMIQSNNRKFIKNISETFNYNVLVFKVLKF